MLNSVIPGDLQTAEAISHRGYISFPTGPTCSTYGPLDLVVGSSSNKCANHIGFGLSSYQYNSQLGAELVYRYTGGFYSCGPNQQASPERSCGLTGLPNTAILRDSSRSTTRLLPQTDLLACLVRWCISSPFQSSLRRMRLHSVIYTRRSKRFMLKIPSLCAESLSSLGLSDKFELWQLPPTQSRYYPTLSLLPGLPACAVLFGTNLLSSAFQGRVLRVFGDVGV